MILRNVGLKYGFYFIIIFISLYTIFSITFYQFQRDQLIDQAKENLQNTTKQLYDQVLVQSSELEPGADFHHVTIDEMEILFAHDLSDHSDRHWTIQFLTQIESNGEVYQDQIDHQKETYLIAGIRSDDVSLAIYLPTARIIAQLLPMKSAFFFIAVLVIIVFVLFAIRLSHRISLPLNQMKRSTHQIINGDFNIKLPMETHDEIGELSMAFNRMSRQLGQKLAILLQEKEILSNVIGSIKDGVMTMNLDGETIISNQEADQFMADFYFEQNSDTTKQLPEPFNRFFQLVIERGKSQSFQINIQGHDWDIVITPLYRDTTIRGAVAIVRDVTEQLKLDQLRETFIANVSHELRTPISLLQGYSEAIIDGVVETVEEQRDLALVIYDESQRMGRLVNELLDLTRLKSGYLELNLQAIKIDSFIKKINKKFANQLRESKISFNYQIDPRLTYAWFDYDRMEQVMTNLIDNAIKHSSENGKIHLTISKEAEQTVFILTDTGSGIPKADLPFVFERFYMADKARSNLNSTGKGTGLGLAIVKQIIEEHHGSISVQSKQGEGTTFKFTLPLNNE